MTEQTEQTDKTGSPMKTEEELQGEGAGDRGDGRGGDRREHLDRGEQPAPPFWQAR